MVRTRKDVVVRAKDDPIGELLAIGKKARKVWWNEDDWDRLALIVWKMKATSTDGLARIASLAQKQFPLHKQRPGVLTVKLLQPLVKRIKAMEEETREKAENADRLAAQVTFFQGLPKTKQEIITSLTDDEIRQHFFGRFLSMLTIADIGSTFSAEQLMGALGTGDLAAVVAKRLVETMERPIQVVIPASEPEKRVVSTHNGHKQPVARKKKIVVIGTRGDEGRHIKDKVGDLCDLTFMEVRDLRPETVPRSADLVILWSKFISKHNRFTVLEYLHSSKIFEHYFGAKELAMKIKTLCSTELAVMKAG